MSVIARITQDGLLSVAGMLVEDPALGPLARFASDGTLHARLLVEDPALAKVEWGRDGVIRCRAFWAGGLWTPPPPAPPKALYVAYYASNLQTSYLIKLNLSDLSILSTVIRENAIWTDGTYDDSNIYMASSYYGYIIDKQSLNYQSISISQTNLKPSCVLNGKLYADLSGVGGQNYIYVYNQQFSLLQQGGPYPTYCSRYHDLGTDGSYLYMFDFYNSEQLFVLKIDKDSLAVSRSAMKSSYQFFPRHFVIDGDLAFVSGARSSGYCKLVKINLSTFTIEDPISFAHSNWIPWGMTVLNDVLFICASGIAPYYAGSRIYKYDKNLNYLGHVELSAYTNNKGLSLITHDGNYLYAISAIIAGTHYTPVILKLTSNLEIVNTITLNYSCYERPRFLAVA